ncbi:dUTP diphosphatase [Bacillus altitudinis]|uniref:dUTP diphosphatase n=1 Tax=Bacillus altitudinis TaxID=293387 RepID=UPI0024C13EAD|nr:dUTP diphosphatase [Bacillus altitudinis]WHX70739.1 dUTP diphosphatase [Bacillus altitudinis]
MNLQKMFEMQKVLDDRIIREKGLEGQDLLPGLILALQVELAECANEWRGFKFWSNDQQPREEKMLEEYVDCLHFILSIGNHIAYLNANDVTDLKFIAVEHRGVSAFRDLFNSISSLSGELKGESIYLSSHDKYFKQKFIERHYQEIFLRFNTLGDYLGFTPEQIEAAYMEKNAVNHKRQQEGY